MNTLSSDKKLRKIGKFLHAHGLRGELYLLIFSGDYSWFDDVTEVYLDSSKKYQIKTFRPHKDGVLVTLDGVINRNQSDELSGCEVWVSADIFVTADDEKEIFLVEVENFEVYDGDKKLGRVVGFSFNGGHDLLIVAAVNLESELKDLSAVGSSVKEESRSFAEVLAHPSEKFEIPFVEDFIEDIDYDEKKIFMNLPEGLIESQRSKETN